MTTLQLVIARLVPGTPSLPGLFRAIQLLNRSAQPNSLYRGFAANESRYA
ncbi:hypothetical protein [Candidatus Spongiihabitans sp.]